MPLTIPLGDWHELTVDKITSLFLYGVDPPPAELFDRIRDQNAPNNDITVTLDANSFMSDPDSPARYALPVLSPFVTAFFSNLSFFFPDLAGIQGSATVADLISNYHVDATLFRFAIRQAYIATDSQDYPARTYIWNSEGFTLSQDTKFVFSDPSDPNFVPHIENLRVLPFDDNFDFGSKDLNSAITAEPNNATAYVKRAEVWMRKGLTDENLDLAVAADPANGLTRRLLDSALNYKQTLPTLRRVFEEQNETEARRKANAPARKR
jgi:hypothetical protein